MLFYWIEVCDLWNAAENGSFDYILLIYNKSKSEDYVTGCGVLDRGFRYFLWT